MPSRPLPSFLGKITAPKWGLLLGTAVLLYCLYWSRFYVGYFNDDATYILAAKSILSGRYCQLASPAHPPINLILPGYPLFLAPFVYLLGPHWAWFKAISIGITLGTGILLAVLWEKASPALLVIVLGCFFMNPIIALYSGSVMSDLFFGFSMLLAFATMNWMMSRPTEGRARILGIVLAGVCLIRPIGVLIPISIALSLALRRQARLSLQCGSVAFILPAVFYISRYRLTQRLNSYLYQWKDSITVIAHNPTLWMHHTTNELHIFLNEGLLGAAYPITTPLAQYLAAMTSLACLLIILRGFRRSVQLKLLPYETLLAMGLWGGLYFTVHTFWTALDPRYSIPMIPLLLPVFIVGVESLCRKSIYSNHARIGAIAMILTSYAFLHVRLIRETRSSNRPAASLMPEETYRWINTFVPPDAILLSRAESTYLYTQRHSFSEIKAGDLEEFRYALMKLRISHIFYQPSSALEVNSGGFSSQWIRDRYYRWAQTWPEAFPLAYRNEKENTQVFRVTPHPLFQKSYQLVLAAEEALKRGEKKKAVADLQDALLAYPTSILAHNLLGSIFAAEGRLDKAKRVYQEALLIRPYHPLTNFNLAVVYRRKGRKHQSQFYLQKCVDSLQGSPELKDFLPLIEEERALMADGRTME